MAWALSERYTALHGGGLDADDSPAQLTATIAGMDTTPLPILLAAHLHAVLALPPCRPHACTRGVGITRHGAGCIRPDVGRTSSHRQRQRHSCIGDVARRAFVFTCLLFPHPHPGAVQDGSTCHLPRPGATTKAGSCLHSRSELGGCAPACVGRDVRTDQSTVVRHTGSETSPLAHELLSAGLVRRTACSIARDRRGMVTRSRFPPLKASSAQPSHSPLGVCVWCYKLCARAAPLPLGGGTRALDTIGSPCRDLVGGL